MAPQLPIVGGEGLENAELREAVMLMIFITLLVCVAQDLAPEAGQWLATLSTDAALLALGVFLFIIFRVWSAARITPVNVELQ